MLRRGLAGRKMVVAEEPCLLALRMHNEAAVKQPKGQVRSEHSRPRLGGELCKATAEIIAKKTNRTAGKRNVGEGSGRDVKPFNGLLQQRERAVTGGLCLPCLGDEGAVATGYQGLARVGHHDIVTAVRVVREA